LNDDPSFQSEPSKPPVRSRFSCLCTVVRLVALALVFVVFVAQDREDSESSSPQGREVSRSWLVVVTILSAIIADKIYGAFWGAVSAGCSFSVSAGEPSSTWFGAGSGSPSDMFGDGVAGNEISGFGGVDWVAGDVSQLVWLTAGQGGPHAADQFAGDSTGGLNVVVASLAHHPLVELCELGVVSSRHVRCLIERQPEFGGSFFGDRSRR
jgi:hypothetical protein